MVMNLIFSHPDDVHDDVCEHMFADLTSSGLSRFTISETFPVGFVHDSLATKTRTARCLIAMLPDTHEIMVTMENTGCAILTVASNINPFTFIQAGFQMTAATILTRVVEGLAQQTRKTEEPIAANYPQLSAPRQEQ